MQAVHYELLVCSDIFVNENKTKGKRKRLAFREHMRTKTTTKQNFSELNKN